MAQSVRKPLKYENALIKKIDSMFRYCFSIFQGVADFLKNTLHSYLGLRGPLQSTFLHSTLGRD